MHRLALIECPYNLQDRAWRCDCVMESLGCMLTKTYHPVHLRSTAYCYIWFAVHLISNIVAHKSSVVTSSLSAAVGSCRPSRTADVLQILNSTANGPMEFTDWYGAAAFILSWITNTWSTVLVSYVAWYTPPTFYGEFFLIFLTSGNTEETS